MAGGATGGGREPVEYILGITREIWEGRAVAAIARHYTEDVVMRTPSGLFRGRQGVINGTLETIALFPDRVLLGEDVIWSSDPEGGYLSSHRIVSTGTHAVGGPLGPASGRRFVMRAVADCAVRDDRIYDEWLVRDQGGLARQLGLEPSELAARQIEAEGGPGACRRPFMPGDDVDGGYHARGNDSPWGDRYAEVLADVMAGRLDVVPRAYDRAVTAACPGAATGLSHAFVDAFWLGLRASFPEAVFTIHHRIGREDALLPPRAALRWSLVGRHSGYGAFGPPSGALVHVMAISHAEFGALGPGGPRIRREFTVYDEVAIWKQILLHRGGAA